MLNIFYQTLILVNNWLRVEISLDYQAGPPWFSILTRTGVFKGKDDHSEFPADLVSWLYNLRFIPNYLFQDTPSLFPRNYELVLE